MSLRPSPSDPTLDTSHTSAQSWDYLRKQARQFENEIDTKLVTYSKQSAKTNQDRNSSQANLLGSDAIEAELEELLKKLSVVVDSMGETLDRPSSTSISTPSMIHMLQRHRDILFDYTKEFRKIKANIRAAREHAELLSQRDEVRFGRGSGSATDHQLMDRGRIDNSHRMMDMTLEQALATREDLDKQRAILTGSNTRMAGVEVRLPSINNIISKIHTRRKRDTYIMAGVASTCIILIMMYMF